MRGLTQPQLYSIHLHLSNAQNSDPDSDFSGELSLTCGVQSRLRQSLADWRLHFYKFHVRYEHDFESNLRRSHASSLPRLSATWMHLQIRKFALHVHC